MDVILPVNKLYKKELSTDCRPGHGAQHQLQMRCLRPNCVACETGSRRLIAGIKPASDGPGGPPVPVDRPSEALGQRDARMPAEEPLGARHVQLPPRLAVRPRSVPADAAAESGFPGDERREIPDGD